MGSLVWIAAFLLPNSDKWPTSQLVVGFRLFRDLIQDLMVGGFCQLQCKS